MKLYGIFPPCFQKERNKGGIFHNGRFLAKISTIFPTVLDLWDSLGAKKIRLRRHFDSFSHFYVDCGTIFIVWETTTSKSELSATDETSSEHFR